MYLFHFWFSKFTNCLIILKWMYISYVFYGHPLLQIFNHFKLGIVIEWYESTFIPFWKRGIFIRYRTIIYKYYLFLLLILLFLDVRKWTIPIFYHYKRTIIMEIFSLTRAWTTFISSPEQVLNLFSLQRHIFSICDI